jgi:hypothetical protein
MCALPASQKILLEINRVFSPACARTLVGNFSL